MSQLSKEDIAIKELEILQAVIARQDEFKEKAKTLAVALFSAISVGFFSGQITLSPLQYFLASFGVCFTFMILEGAYGTTEINAEKRVRRIEQYLRSTPSDPDFQTPDIADSLLAEGTFKSLLQSMVRWRTLFLYVLLVLLSGLATVFITPSVPAFEADRNLLLEVSERRQHNEKVEKVIRDQMANNIRSIEILLSEMQKSFKRDLQNGVEQLQLVPKTK
jgi:hypothetical protein